MIRKELETEDMPSSQMQDGQVITITDMLCNGMEIEGLQ